MQSPPFFTFKIVQMCLVLVPGGHRQPAARLSSLQDATTSEAIPDIQL